MSGGFFISYYLLLDYKHNDLDWIPHLLDYLSLDKTTSQSMQRSKFSTSRTYTDYNIRVLAGTPHHKASSPP
jgi:hypothetical protein